MRHSNPFRILAGLLLALTLASPIPAQVKSVDPNADFNRTETAPVTQPKIAANQVVDDTADVPAVEDETVPATPQTGGMAKPTENGTFAKDDLIAEAEGVFGKGAAGLAGLLEKVLKDQGEPNAYISGREASGALVLGVRYGSGTIKHAVEGESKVYWTGPSIGFDAGGDASKVFVLVYNLYDGQDLYRRFPQVEGRAFYVGGASATYLRRGRIAMIPIRLGVGARLGANIGYMKFSEKAKWLPF